MKFSGLQKLTLLDYPGKVACTVFTCGCNFRCPFCHNGGLVEGDICETYSQEEILSFLESRKGILDGICITGGEPLLNKDIKDFIKKVKELGFLVKLDTNGSIPGLLKELVGEGIIDYVAMDIKNTPEKYPETAGADESVTKKTEESISFLLEGNVDYEFRTTVVDELHSVEDIEEIAKSIKGAKRYYLQSFVDSENVLQENLHAPSLEKITEMKAVSTPYIGTVELRGV